MGRGEPPVCRVLSDPGRWICQGGSLVEGEVFETSFQQLVVIKFQKTETLETYLFGVFCKVDRHGK